jgi:glutamate formiminotransferase
VDLLECVPNVSEGRRPEVVDHLAAAAEAGGARLLHRTSDPDHHRSVLTLAGTPEALRRSILALFETALQAIDLRRHHGVHPRIGAVDVVPFVPLGSVSLGQARELAAEVGAEVARRFGVPVYLYGEGVSAERSNLADLRRGGLEGLALRLVDPAWKPDFGPATLHPTAGATVVGARRFLIAYNVVLRSADLRAARRIARAVRESSGGLPAVKALGLPLASRGLVQVSMNLVDYRRTSIFEVFNRVAILAELQGAEVLESELIGLVPEEALEGGDVERLRLADFTEDRVLENRLRAVGLVG